ncbi:MAG: FliA/WhiG family RNA polymerase sigma factor [Oscillospiraceae bacterium]|nr:FliA/WhiG family RNA polymerase sigma factor [Oscillospiraceae bacterium]
MTSSTAVAEKESAVVEGIWEQYAKTRDPHLRNDIVMTYSGLVKGIALRMRGIYKNYAQLDDVVNQGIIALIDAVEKYDPARGIKFETFASIKVKGSIIDFIRSQDWIPRRLRKLSGDLESTNARLCSEMGRTPTHSELAEAMNLSVERLDRVMEQTYNFNLLSYEEVVWQKLSAMGGDIADDSTEDSPEGKLMETELYDQLAMAVDKLNERERTVISLYYHERLKLKEIAQILSVSESRVCQIHSAAIIKMKGTMKQYLEM